MSILYCEISQDNRNRVHVEHAREPELLPLFEQILKQLPPDVFEFEIPKRTIICGNHQIMYFLDHDMVWLCVADIVSIHFIRTTSP